MGLVLKKHVALFIFLTFLSSWTIWFLSGVFDQDKFSYNHNWLFAQFGVFAPSIIASIILILKGKSFRKRHYLYVIISTLILFTGFVISQNKFNSISNFNVFVSLIVILVGLLSLFTIYKGNYLYYFENHQRPKAKINFLIASSSLLLFPILFFICWLLTNFGNNSFEIQLFDKDLVTFIKNLIVIFFMNLILGGSFGEELGWRGYLLPELLRNYNPQTASLILGIIWAFWHLPIDLMSQANLNVFLVLFRIIWSIPLSIIFTWFFIKSHGSLLTILILHTSINILPEIGFSNYESSIVLLTLFMIILSFIILTKPIMKNRMNDHILD